MATLNVDIVSWFEKIHIQKSLFSGYLWSSDRTDFSNQKSHRVCFLLVKKCVKKFKKFTHLRVGNTITGNLQCRSVVAN